eukprot:TRINITY_DN27120_c0_g1_i1.p1 TRINITY_DN27120_c0_g1~~TRINITY_DN27120_c0_g1_i1.p1  ORF type:complete len:321 (+),score=95.05 TRINITY_DN27120_c0_g1_i1:107-1069(+)
MMIPFMIAFTVVPISAVATFWKSREKFFLRDFLSKRGAPLIILFSMTMYTFLVSSAVSPFKCNYSSGSFVAMFDDPSRSCFDSDWKQHLFEVIIFTLLYAVGIPALMITIFWKNRQNVQNLEFIAAYGSVTRMYREKFFWWEIVQILKRSAFAIMNAFLLVLSTQYAAIFATLCLMCLFVVVEVAVKPYKNYNDLMLSTTFCMIEVIVLLTNGVIFQVDAVSAESKNTFGILLAVLISLIIAIAILRVLAEAFKAHKSQGSTVPPAAALSLPEDKPLTSTTEGEQVEVIPTKVNRLRVASTRDGETRLRVSSAAAEPLAP